MQLDEPAYETVEGSLPKARPVNKVPSKMMQMDFILPRLSLRILLDENEILNVFDVPKIDLYQVVEKQEITRRGFFICPSIAL